MNKHQPNDPGLLAELGIATHYVGVDGIDRPAPAQTISSLLEELGFPERLSIPKSSGVMTAPDGVRCFLPAFLDDERAWGISAQLYELRSSRNWGIGDFDDLRTLCQITAEAGADFVGLNPLHALFLADPARYSPYSPSNRLFLNPLYLAVDKLPGFQSSLVDAKTLADLRAAEYVDYEAVSAVKLKVLKHLWNEWNSRGNMDLPRSEFEEFKDQAGDYLLRHCLFESLSFAMTAAGYGSGWHSWPQEYQDYRSSSVRDFAAGHRDDIEFCAWLQWLSAQQLQAAAGFAKDCGLRIGLYLDFAVGEVPDGSSTWSHPDLVLPGMRIGAPPDAFATAGQDWGLVPISPNVLGSDGSYFQQLIDHTARFAGAIRLDHAMSLWQLFLIPSGSAAAAGTYLRYPFAEMIASLAAVSQSRQTIVIGEDLGNVPPGFRAALRRAGVLGYNVLYFEDADIRTVETTAAAIPSLACLSTHDLVPLAGWWRGDDIRFAESIGWCDADTARNLQAMREKRKRGLLLNLVSESLIDKALGTDCQADLNDDIVVALHLLISRKKTLLTAMRLADLVGEYRATNIPGTKDEYPNWRVKLRTGTHELRNRSTFLTIARSLKDDAK